MPKGRVSIELIAHDCVLNLLSLSPVLIRNFQRRYFWSMMKSLEMITMCARSRDILPSKMADGSGGTESQLLGKFMEKQTKYGTTTRLVTKSSIAAKHKVCQSDTLMGIALKYGSTVLRHLLSKTNIIFFFTAVR